MELNLIGGSYANTHPEINTQRTINWLPIVTSQSEQNKKKIQLVRYPGLTEYVNLPGRYIRALFTARTHFYTECFAVVDTTLYQINDNGSYTTRGVLSNLPKGSSRLFTECNLQNEVFFSGYEASYVYDMDTETVTQVTDPYFPNNVTGGTYLDQYTIVCANGAVFESLTTSMLNWSATQTYSPTFKSAPVLAVGATKEQIFNFTTETIEVFVNDGTSPYSRLPRTSMLIGIKAKDTLATWDNGFIFLGGSRIGDAAVYFYDGYNPPKAISDYDITESINISASLEDAYGFIQQTKTGQTLYHLSIPDLKTTFVFNFSSGLWSERQSTNPSINADGTQDQDVYRGSFHTSFNGKNLVADRYSGKIFIEDSTNKTEDNQIIMCTRVTQPLSQEDKNNSFDRMIVDCNTGSATPAGQGSDPQLLLYCSNDSGHTYSPARTIRLGLQGQYNYRARIEQLGTSRRRVYKLVLTDPIDLIIQSFYVNGTMDET